MQPQDDSLDNSVQDKDLEQDQSTPEDERRDRAENPDDAGIPRPSEDADADADMDEQVGGNHETR
jgi:hypothetical protein